MARPGIQRLTIRDYRLLQDVTFDSVTGRGRQPAALAEAGGLLGDLWLEGYFGLGDPLVRSGRPR